MAGQARLFSFSQHASSKSNKSQRKPRQPGPGQFPTVSKTRAGWHLWHPWSLIESANGLQLHHRSNVETIKTNKSYIHITSSRYETRHCPYLTFLLVLIHAVTQLGIISTLLMTIYEKSHCDDILWKYLPASPWQYCCNVDNMRRLLKTVRMFAFVTQSNHLLSVFEQILKYQDIYCLSPSPILSCHFTGKRYEQ